MNKSRPFASINGQINNEVLFGAYQVLTLVLMEYSIPLIWKFIKFSLKHSMQYPKKIGT
jgi:hypothetical protein